MLASRSIMDARDPSMAKPKILAERAGLALFASLFAAAWWATAWVADDAFITFRTVDNALHGHGLVWNVGERVQTYTHPLWMALLWLAASFTGELFFTVLALCALATLAAFAAIARVPGVSRAGLALALALAFASRAFVDYSSSGLENALVHALVVALVGVCARPSASDGAQLARVVLVSALLLSRVDLLFLAAPIAGFAFWRDGLPRVRIALAGVLPLVAWELFSLVYYGALVANSALAKLTSGIAPAERVVRGVQYIASSAGDDPITIAALVAALALAFARRDALRAPLALAIAAHCAWVAWVGGDFMRGRFLTPALAVALVALARAGSDERHRAATWATAVAVSALALATPYLSPFAVRDYGPDWHGAIDAHGVADERHFHREISSLECVRAGRGFSAPANVALNEAQRAVWYLDPYFGALASIGMLDERAGWPPANEQEARSLRPVLVKGGVGLLGYSVGPSFYVIDYHGLGDPLLARLPALPRDLVLAGLIPRLAPLRWRAGHYLRPVPAGYAESRSRRENLVRDPDLARVVDRIDEVVSGPLFSASRWRAIAALHGSQTRAALARYVARAPLYSQEQRR